MTMTADHVFHLRKGSDDVEMVEVALPERITYKKVAITRPAPKAPANERKDKR